jgi:transcriptional regulator with XRE-family HTH domain
MSEGIGGRIAVERKLRGLTQRQLADRAHVSLSLLRKVEQGNKPASAALTASVARALGLERTHLTGQPYRTGNRRLDALHDLVPDIRRELVAYRLPPDDEQAGAVPALAELHAAVASVSAARHAVDLTELAELLPVVLADLRAAAWTSTGSQREQVMRLMAETYYAARQLLHKLGYPDLASLVADRYEWAAEQAGDPLALALAGVFRASELDAVADWRGACSVMSHTLDIFPAQRDDGDAISVRGFLHLMAAYMSAHAGDAADTWSHHADAEDLAARLGRDGDAYRLAFGPTNVGIWGTALGVELMDGGRAVERARRVHLTPDTPAERAGHHYLDLARAQLMNGDRPGVLESLLTARRIAPQQTRHHPMARETVLSLARAERRSTETLRGMAAWMGLND